MSLFKDKQIVILGGAGFIGTNLTNKLVIAGAKVRVFTRAGRSVKNLASVLDKIELMYGDFMDEVALKKATQDADFIVHLISTTFPGTSIDNGVYDIYSNLIPTLRLLEICKGSHGKKIIYASSGGTVYGEFSGGLVSEDQLLNPTSMYGQSKKVVESYLNFFAKNSDVVIQTLRLSNPFGPFQNPYGAQGVVAVAFRCALDQSVFKIFGSGETIRDYIYIDDVTDGIMSAIKSETSNVVNISSGQGRSVLEVLECVQKISGREMRTNFIEQRKGDVSISLLSNAKAKEAYDWHPKISFEEGLARTWQWIAGEVSS